MSGFVIIIITLINSLVETTACSIYCCWHLLVVLVRQGTCPLFVWLLRWAVWDGIHYQVLLSFMARLLPFLQVVVTEVESCVRFWAQKVEQGGYFISNGNCMHKTGSVSAGFYLTHAPSIRYLGITKYTQYYCTANATVSWC